MKTIMIINEDPVNINKIRNHFKNQEIEIICANNSRSGINFLNEHKGINLVLVKTKHPDLDNNALFPLNPRSDLSLNSIDNSMYLSEPFSEEEFSEFIKNHLKNNEL